MTQVVLGHKLSVEREKTHQLALDIIASFPHEDWIVGNEKEGDLGSVGFVHDSSKVAYDHREEARKQAGIQDATTLTFYLTPRHDKRIVRVNSSISVVHNADDPITLQPSQGKPENVYLSMMSALHPGYQDHFDVSALRNEGTQDIIEKIVNEGYKIDWFSLHEPNPRIKHLSRIVLIDDPVLGSTADLEVTIYKRKDSEKYARSLDKFVKKLDKKYNFKERKD